MWRSERFDLNALEAHNLQSCDVSKEMRQRGYKMNEATLSRLRTGSDINIDVAGLPFYAIQRIFATPSGVAVVAQTATLLIRRAHADGDTGDELDEALTLAGEAIDDAEIRYAQLKSSSRGEEAERHLDLASIFEAKGQVAATKSLHVEALGHFLKAYQVLLPVARATGCQLGAIICLGRVLAAALNESFDADEIEGRPVGLAPAEPGWHLTKVVKFYKAPHPTTLLMKAVEITGDDRMAAQHVDGFGLAKEPRQAARMMEVGLRHSDGSKLLQTWQPNGRTEPVINEPYLQEAVVEFKRLQARVDDRKDGIKRRIVLAVIGATVGLVLSAGAFVKHAEARPQRFTSINIMLSHVG